jgi:nucleoside-diphosphate-sugar epimerase
MKTVLVTGASGFVGRQTLLPLLERGYKVIAVARRPLVDISNVPWVEADLLDEGSRRHLLATVKPDYLLHAAWYAVPGKFWEAPENRDWLMASQDLVREFTHQGGRRALVLGSCAEYDWRRSDSAPWRETDPCEPQTLYGQSKLALLRSIEANAGEVLWARLFLMFGPHEPPEKLISSICRGLAAGEPVLCSSGGQVRDFMDVRDVGACLAALLDSDAEGVINVGSGTPVTIADVARLLGDIAGKPELIRLGALPNRTNEPGTMVADISRLNQVVSLKTPPLRQRLAEVYEEHTARVY